MDRDLQVKPEQVQGPTEFTLNLYKEVVKDLGNNNAALSPLSIGIALSMVSAGANGPTLQQIADCIKLPPGDKTHEFSHQLTTVALADGSKAGGPQLASANRVLVEQSIKLKPAFQKIVKQSYGSDVGSVDFKHKVKLKPTGVPNFTDSVSTKCSPLLRCSITATNFKAIELSFSPIVLVVGWELVVLHTTPSMFGKLSCLEVVWRFERRTFYIGSLSVKVMWHA